MSTEIKSKSLTSINMEAKRQNDEIDAALQMINIEESKNQKQTKLEPMFIVNTSPSNSKLFKKLKKGFVIRPKKDPSTLYEYDHSSSMVDITKNAAYPYAKILTMLATSKVDNTVTPVDYFEFIDVFLDESDYKDTKIHNLVKLLCDEEFLEHLDVEKLKRDFFTEKHMRKATISDMISETQDDQTDCSSSKTGTTIINNYNQNRNSEHDNKYGMGDTSESQNEDEKDYDIDISGFVDFRGKKVKFNELSAKDKQLYKDLLKRKEQEQHKQDILALEATGNVEILKSKETDIVINKAKKEKETVPRNRLAIDLVTPNKLTNEPLTPQSVWKNNVDITKVDLKEKLREIELDEVDSLTRWSYREKGLLTSKHKKVPNTKRIKQLNSILHQLPEASKPGSKVSLFDLNSQLKGNKIIEETDKKNIHLIAVPNTLCSMTFPAIQDEGRTIAYNTQIESFNHWKNLNKEQFANATFKDFMKVQTPEQIEENRIKTVMNMCTLFTKTPYNPYCSQESANVKQVSITNKLPCAGTNHNNAYTSWIIETEADPLNRKASLLFSMRYGCRIGSEPESEYLPSFEAAVYLIPYDKLSNIQQTKTTKFPQKIPVLIINNYLSYYLTGYFQQSIVILTDTVDYAYKPFNFKAYHQYTMTDLIESKMNSFRTLANECLDSIEKYVNAKELNKSITHDAESVFNAICEKVRSFLIVDAPTLKNLGKLNNKLRLQLDHKKVSINDDEEKIIMNHMVAAISQTINGTDIEDKRQRAWERLQNFARLTKSQKSDFIECLKRCISTEKLGHTHYENAFLTIDDNTNMYKTPCCRQNETVSDSQDIVIHPCMLHALADGSGKSKAEDTISQIKDCGICHARYTSVITSSLCYIACLYERSIKRSYRDEKQAKQADELKKKIQDELDSLQK